MYSQCPGLRNQGRSGLRTTEIGTWIGSSSGADRADMMWSLVPKRKHLRRRITKLALSSPSNGGLLSFGERIRFLSMACLS
jgi:hypothetical protein